MGSEQVVVETVVSMAERCPMPGPQTGPTFAVLRLPCTWLQNVPVLDSWRRTSLTFRQACEDAETLRCNEQWNNRRSCTLVYVGVELLSRGEDSLQ